MLQHTFQPILESSLWPILLPVIFCCCSAAWTASCLPLFAMKVISSSGGMSAESITRFYLLQLSHAHPAGSQDMWGMNYKRTVCEVMSSRPVPLVHGHLHMSIATVSA